MVQSGSESLQACRGASAGAGGGVGDGEGRRPLGGGGGGSKEAGRGEGGCGLGLGNGDGDGWGEGLEGGGGGGGRGEGLGGGGERLGGGGGGLGRGGGGGGGCGGGNAVRVGRWCEALAAATMITTRVMRPIEPTCQRQMRGCRVGAEGRAAGGEYQGEKGDAGALAGRLRRSPAAAYNQRRLEMPKASP